MKEIDDMTFSELEEEYKRCKGQYQFWKKRKEIILDKLIDMTPLRCADMPTIEKARA